MTFEAVGSYNRRFFPIEMDSRPIHPSKAFFTIFSMLSGRYKLFKAELKNNAAKINGSYKYVEWIYAHDDDTEETFRYENGVESYEEG